MTLAPTQRELLIEIARCHMADETLDSLAGGTKSENLPCETICAFQRKATEEFRQADNPSHGGAEFTKSMFHMPEPWNGNLETAEVLFVSSNPSYDAKEHFPTLDTDEWTDDRVADFFVNRFDNYSNRYWSGILKYAGYILEITDSLKKVDDEATRRAIASRIALTEIVHCKSTKEIGVKKAAQTCFDTHTKEVIQHFLESPSAPKKTKTVVFVGGAARNLIKTLAKASNSKRKDNELACYFQDEFGGYNETARCIFIPHTNGRSWKSWNPGKKHEPLNDGERQAIIDNEMEHNSQVK